MQIVGGIRESLKLPDLKVAWVAVTPGNRIPELVKGTIDLECGSTTITFSRMEEVTRAGGLIGIVSHVAGDASA